jgi:asparagine synthase (glutamine-hydrolysing)
MCGITALIRWRSDPIDAAVLHAMTELVAHRGPDGSGTTFLHLDASGASDVAPNGAWTVGLGHRRLSILDLSDSGRQPMKYGDDLWITYNGEIFNFVELKQELERLGHRFRSRTDTEVLLAAYAQWGTAAFERMRGMWGLAIVDAKKRRCVVSRDRLGIKPLYYRSFSSAIAIASEIKQFTALPQIELKTNEDALDDYLTTGYEHASRTFFSGIESLPAGTWMEIPLDAPRVSAPVSYWHPERIHPMIKEPSEAAERFAGALRESVRIHLRSDVPVGCAMSGGLDSSAIASLVHEVGDRGDDSPFLTFTATFPRDPSDERPYVDRALAGMKAIPNFVTPTPDAMLAELDRFVWIHDEPVGHSSQYAGWCIARITRERGVPVTLNGQGGDEVLGGYWQSYLMHLRALARDMRPIELLRHIAGAIVPGGNPELLKQFPIMARRYVDRRRGTKGAKQILSNVFGMNDSERRLFEIREMYLPRLLKWDDRNFMAFSVEGRYPFLDHVLIDTALSFAPEALYSRGWMKVPLRRGLGGVLPEAISMRRTKFGFETPQARWLKGALAPAIDHWVGGDSPVWSRLDRNRLRRMVEESRSAPPGQDEAGHAVFRAFLADRWMRVFSL